MGNFSKIKKSTSCLTSIFFPITAISELLTANGVLCFIKIMTCQMACESLFVALQSLFSEKFLTF